MWVNPNGSIRSSRHFHSVVSHYKVVLTKMGWMGLFSEEPHNSKAKVTWMHLAINILLFRTPPPTTAFAEEVVAMRGSKNFTHCTTFECKQELPMCVVLVVSITRPSSIQCREGLPIKHPVIIIRGGVRLILFAREGGSGGLNSLWRNPKSIILNPPYSRL